MVEIKKNLVKVKNPTTGRYESVAGLGGAPGEKGESMYDIAVKNGFTGTEEDFLNEFTPDGVLAAVKAVSDKVHDHKNKAVLDLITSESFHSHENANILAGITVEKIAEWNGKQDKPISIEVSLPAETGWVEETDEEIQAMGITYRYAYLTDVAFSQVTDVSGSVSPVHNDAANTAGLLDNVGYDENENGKVEVYFFSKKVPTSSITVFLKIYR